MLISQFPNDYFSAAQDAVSYTSDTILAVSNLPDKNLSKYRDLKGNITQEYMDKVLIVANFKRLFTDLCIDRCSKVSEKGKFMSPVDRVIWIANQSEKFSIGGCDEHAFVTFKYIMEHCPVIERIDIYTIINGKHSFLAIGKGEKSDLENDVIIDPWNPNPDYQIYSAREYKQKLHDFKGLDSNAKPILELFDPTMQDLKRSVHYVRNRTSQLDFAKFFKF